MRYMHKDLRDRQLTIITGKGNPLISVKVRRNALCACNSGLKFKNCCGDTTRYFVKKLKDKV